MYKINKKVFLLPLTAIFIAMFAASVSAMLSFDMPDVTFPEDSSNSTFDLDSYVSGAVGGVSWFVMTQGAHTKAAIDGTTHVVTFTADANWNGIENITIVAQDSMTLATGDIVKVTVTAVNDAPTITAPSGTLTAKVGTQFTYQVNATDVDIGDTLTYTATAGSWTTFSMSSAGLIQFTPQDVDIGLHDISLTVRDTAGTNATRDFTIFVTEACDDESIDIRSIDIQDITDDDSETVPGDYIEADFDIFNAMTKDMSDVKAKAWLQNADGARVGSKVETEADDLESKDSRSETLKLRVDPTAKSGTYTLFIRAEGTDYDNNDKCGLYAKTWSIRRNSHELMIDNAKITPEAPVCGGKAQVTAMIYNIGSTTEDEVKFRVRSSEMNIDLYSPMFELRTSGSSAKAEKTLSIDIPATAKGTYVAEVSAMFNGGSDSVTTTVSIPVTCGATTTATTSTATTTAASTGAISIPMPSASAESGQSVKFTALVKNTEAADKTYAISLAGTSDWATATVEPAEITLSPGTEVPIYIYLTPKAGVYGEQTATVTVKSGTTVLGTKTLTVSMPQKPTTTVTQKTSGTSLVADIELTEEAKIAIIVVVLLIAGGYVVMKYKASQGVKVYGKKKGRKSEDDEEL